MLNKEALEIINRKLKQGKRVEIEYNHQKDELKILEHKITRVRLGGRKECVRLHYMIR